MSPSKAPLNDPEKEPVAMALVIKGLSILIIRCYFLFIINILFYFFTITLPVKLLSNSIYTAFELDADIIPGIAWNLSLS